MFIKITKKSKYRRSGEDRQFPFKLPCSGAVSSLNTAEAVRIGNLLLSRTNLNLPECLNTAEAVRIGN